MNQYDDIPDWWSGAGDSNVPGRKWLALAVARAVAAEREACIKLIEPSSELGSDPTDYIGGAEVVELLDELCDAIRARGGNV